ncbi:hypothetical protein, partial [Caballeronia sordidicola]|uniref:hypothetical protein n=1 Tax=Caballeronia sordidicola TaxID=196367 RepID=UPI0015C4F6BC
EKLSDQHFVDPLPPTVPEMRPSGEMRDAAKIGNNRLCSVPALVQVLLERTNAWPDRPVGEKVYVSEVGTANDAHDDLQKWDHHCILRHKLCPDLYAFDPPTLRHDWGGVIGRRPSVHSCDLSIGVG